MFTTTVGGQIPCYSSSTDEVPPPTLTAGLAGNPTDTSKPTSAVVNIVWSMRYPVADPSGSGLSTAAKAGIGAGAGVAAILIGVLTFCLWRSRRKNKKLESEKAAQAAPVPPSQPLAMQQAMVPNGQHVQYPPGAPVPGMLDPSGHGGMVANASVSTPSPLLSQTTGTSNGGISELSPQSSLGLLQNGGYFAATPNSGMPYASSTGTSSPLPVANGIGYPPPIAEADEGQRFHGESPPLQYGQAPYNYSQQQPQQFVAQQSQFYPAQPGQQMPPTLQGQQPQFYTMAPQQQPGQPQIGYGQMSAQGYPIPQQQTYPTPPPTYAMQQPQGGYSVSPSQQQQIYQPQAQSPRNVNMSEMSAGRETEPPQEVPGSQMR